MTWIQLIGGLLFCLESMGQPSHLQTENGYIRTGAYSTHFIDAFSFTTNPACLGSMKNFIAGVLAERKWMLKELDSYTLSASGNFENGGFGIGLQYSGDAQYSEQALALAYGKNLGRLELGIRFGYLKNQTSGYRTVGFGSCGIGMRFHVSDKLIAGWTMELPVFGMAGKTNSEKGSQFFGMGLGYESGQEVFLAIEIEKVSEQPVNVIGSVEYRYGEQFFFSFGINSSLAAPCIKSGWKKNQLCIQIYTVYEGVLGFSPGVVFLWDGKNKKGR